MITWAQVRERYRRAGCEVPRSCGRWSESPTDEELLRVVEAGAMALGRADEVADAREALEHAESERDQTFDDLDQAEGQRDEALLELEAARGELARLTTELEAALDGGERAAIQSETYPTSWDRIANA